MHLTEDGFKSLVAPDSRWKPVSYFDSKTWRELWVDFMAEARRFDGRKLHSLFGDDEPIRRPPENHLDWSARDRLLIGEFIRRHHARLAHEIALYGVPAKDGTPYNFFPENAQKETADLSGLVARSHGLSLRTCVGYLRDEYDVRDFDGVHAVYLMVLLRIADYLQIQSGRAPSETLDLRTLHSPVSQGEWKVHACVRNITTEGEDPEAILIDARPEDIRTYLRIREWLGGIQKELDMSWAVLGEVYGRYSGLDGLDLRLRRVRSNLDDDSKTSHDFEYVPKRIAFDAANPDLLKLLVGPLYSDDAGIGVRELIQNAVDAVWELEDLIEQRPELGNIERRKQKADVVIVIELDDDNQPKSLTISDRGVGMNLDVVENYFLRAGASFRNSDAWKRQHEDEDGHSRVLRSGRFGVGALAAFLIGNEIRVTTRHAEDEKSDGLQFSARLDEDALDIRRISCPVGTEIAVIIPEDMRERWGGQFLFISTEHGRTKTLDDFDKLNHYRLVEPSLSCVINPHKIELFIEKTLPSRKNRFSYPWRFVEHEKYWGIHWKYGEGESLSCNGITISNQRYHSYDNLHISSPPLMIPRASIFDPDGDLPVNLQRDTVIGGIQSYHDELLESVVCDMIAYALVMGPEQTRKASEIKWMSGKFLGFSSTRWRESVFGYRPLWAVGRNGFTLNHRHIYGVMGVKSVFAAFVANSSNPLSEHRYISLLNNNQVVTSFGYFPNNLNTTKSCISSVLSRTNPVPITAESGVIGLAAR